MRGAMAKRVLVVDDDPQVVKIIQRALEREGLEVAVATNGAEALLAIGRQRPDLVILDVVMPVMDGFQALRALREKPETKDLPVLMLTARSEDRDVARGWTAGVDLYLTKPFTMEELLTATRRMLEVTGAEEAGAEG